MSSDAPSPEMRETVSESLLEQLIQSLSVIDEPRAARGIRHPLINVVAIAVLGCLCRCDDAEALEDWARKEQAWLSKFLDFPHGTPSQDVFLRVLAAIDPESFRSAFLTWMQAVFSVLGVGDQVAIDGQTHRGSRGKRSGKKALHMVHALLCETGLVIGQVATAEKSNEITAIPALLDLLDIRGALISIDAMGTQVKIARKIRSKGGDYLLALTGNQTNFYAQVKAAFREAADDRKRTIDEVAPPQVEADTQVNGGHGRVETRTARVLTEFEPWVQDSLRWKDIRCLVQITAMREDLSTGKSSTEVRHYFSSRMLSAAEANERVRSHWLVENRLHWCLDMTFGQDACRIRTGHATENFAIVRHFALNIIRGYEGDKYSVPRRRRLCDFDASYRERVLAAVG